MHHLKLGPLQADPPNVKLRAATGFDAADYLLANYWVWAKLLENLAMIGYDAWHISNHLDLFTLWDSGQRPVNSPQAGLHVCS